MKSNDNSSGNRKWFKSEPPGINSKSRRWIIQDRPSVHSKNQRDTQHQTITEKLSLAADEKPSVVAGDTKAPSMIFFLGIFIMAIGAVRGGIWGFHALNPSGDDYLFAFIAGGLIFGPIASTIGDLIPIINAFHGIETVGLELLRGGTCCFVGGIFLMAIGAKDE